MNPPPPMRILLLNRALPEHVAGGLERHVEDLAFGLAARGHAVHLLAAPASAETRARHAAAGVALHAVPVARAARYSLAWLRGVGPALDALLARERFDLIHAQEFSTGLWRPGPGAPPLLLGVHGTLTSETPLHPDVLPLLPWGRHPAAWLRYGRRLLFAPAWRRMLAAARLILVDSEFSRGEVQRFLPAATRRLRLVPLSVTPPGQIPDRAAARAQLGWPERRLTLLTFGRLEWAKGHEVALRALAGLRGHEWHYVIAGEGSEAARLRGLAGRLGLADRVTFAGRVEEALKWPMLAAADLFLWPERTHPAFGLAGLEALLAETPVLATRRGAIPEVLAAQLAAFADRPRAREVNWMVDAPTPAALGAPLARLLADPALLAEARPGLRDAALAHFSLDRMLDNLLAVYREALAPPAPRPPA